MTNKLQLIAILTLATVLITGGFGLAPFAYSTNNDHDDDDDDDGKDDDDDDGKDDDDDDGKDDDDDCKDDDEEPSTATITLFKAITNDNDGKAEAVDFEIKVDTTMATLGVAVPITPGTHTISEKALDGYSFVLISGDTQCPSKLDTPFIVKGGDHIECTIYNEDNFVEGQTGGEGVIFRHFSMKVQLNDPNNNDSCDNVAQFPTAADKTACVEIVNPIDGKIGIVDSALKDDTTIILFSVIEANAFNVGLGAENPNCSIQAILQHNLDSTYLDGEMDPDTGEPTRPTNPSSNNLVLLDCPDMVSNQIYNVNYIMVDPALA